ncbi:MAG TPA: hypothetical protein VHK90_03840, partial [Thermoanaerobaculia bacterium]|nr:hypothetical protein [Thermoanaerobaculia bacterium]
MSSTSVSVVVPRRRTGFNPSSLEPIAKFLETTGFTFEILTPEGEAYGPALRKGVSDAKGTVIVIVDDSLPYPVSAIGDAVAMVESGATDVVFASTRADFTGPLLPRWLLVPIVPDPAIHLFAFSSTAGKIVVGESRLSDGGCELEIAYLINKYGFRIERLVVQPSNGHTRSFGKLGGLVATISVRVANRRNEYRAARRCPVCFSPEVWTCAQIPHNVVRACRRCKC